MTSPHSSDTLSFGEEHFGTASLGDLRRTRRLVHCANEMISHPDGSLPAKFGSPGELNAFYALMNSPAVTHESVLAPHRAWTLERMRRHEEAVLILHDTTELDYTSRHSLTGLGQIGNGHGRGYECHNSLAVDGQAREVIGFVGQQLHRRAQAPKDEGVAAKRARKDRESRLWVEGLASVGPAPEGKVWVDICDSGADTFEFLEAASKQGPGRFFVVRSSISRSMHVGHGEATKTRAKLHAHASALPERRRYQLQVPAKRLAVKDKRGRKRKDRSKTAPALPKRNATIAVSAGPVRVLAPHVRRGEHGREPLWLWVVAACEVDVPEGMQPVEWFLLTNHPVQQAEQAETIIQWYCFRWIIEELHKAMKTGCGVENPQFTTEEALKPTIALLSVVAVSLLQVREAVRRPDAKERRAVELVPSEWVEILSLWRHNEHRPDWSIHEFYYALARLGGHQNRKSDHFPGWLVLWRGWQRFQPMLQGARLRKRCGIT